MLEGGVDAYFFFNDSKSVKKYKMAKLPWIDTVPTAVRLFCLFPCTHASSSLEHHVLEEVLAG